MRVLGTPASYNILSKTWKEELDKLRLALEELKGKVFGNGGGGGGLDCSKDSIHCPEDAGAVLEKAQLVAIPVACFVTPHVLMEFIYCCLFDLMQPGERDAVSLQISHAACHAEDVQWYHGGSGHDIFGSRESNCYRRCTYSIFGYFAADYQAP